MPTPLPRRSCRYKRREEGKAKGQGAVRTSGEECSLNQHLLRGTKRDVQSSYTVNVRNIKLSVDIFGIPQELDGALARLAA